MIIKNKEEKQIETYSEVRLLMSPSGNVYVDDGGNLLRPLLVPIALTGRYGAAFCDLKNEIEIL